MFDDSVFKSAMMTSNFVDTSDFHETISLTVEALLSEICQNRRFPKNWVTLCANFR